MKCIYTVYIMGEKVGGGQLEVLIDWKQELCDLIEKLTSTYGTWAEIRLVLLGKE